MFIDHLSSLLIPKILSSIIYWNKKNLLILWLQTTNWPFWTQRHVTLWFWPSRTIKEITKPTKKIQMMAKMTKKKKKNCPSIERFWSPETSFPVCRPRYSTFPPTEDMSTWLITFLRWNTHWLLFQCMQVYIPAEANRIFIYFT